MLEASSIIGTILKEEEMLKLYAKLCIRAKDISTRTINTTVSSLAYVLTNASLLEKYKALLIASISCLINNIC